MSARKTIGGSIGAIFVLSISQKISVEEVPWINAVLDNKPKTIIFI